MNVAANTESGGFSTIGYQLTQGLDITNSDTTSNNVVTGIRVISAASTETGNKTYVWNGDYNITKSDPTPGGNSASVTGFEFMHSSTAGEAAIFAGTISGESMTIVNMQTGAARGLSFHQNSSGGFDIRGGFNGIIDIEALEVSGKGNDQWGHSTGLFAGNLGTLTGDGSAVNINIDTLNVSSDSGNAAGIDVGNIGNNATLTFGDISADADEYAVAFKAGNLGTGVTITIKSVTSTANDSALGVGINEIGDGARINIDNIQADGIYGDGIGFQANIVNQSTLTFGGFTAVADYTAEGIQIGSLNSGATLNITGVGNATTFSYDGSGIATGVSIGSITGATINAKESTIYANVKDSDWGTGSGDATAVSVVGNIADSTLTFGTLDATVDKVGTAIGFSAQNVDASTITVDSINAQTLSVTETSTTGKGDAIGFQAQDISASSLSIAHAGTMTFDGDATGVDLRDIGDEAALTIGHIGAAAMNTGDAVGLSAQNVGENVTIEIKSTKTISRDGYADGVVLDDIGDGTEITIGTIEADGQYGAWGMSVDDIGNKVAIDVTTIDVKGNNGDAMGFLADDIGNGATLTFGDINAETESSGYSDGNATALSAGNVGSNVTIKINSVSAYSDAGDAEGVILGDIGNGAKITIGSIEAFGDDDAMGMQVQNVTDSELKIGSISAEAVSYGNAVGFEAVEMDNSHLTLDDVSATTDIGNATGVLVDGDILNGAILTVNDGITATTRTSGNTVGLAALDVDAGQILAHNADIIAINNADGTDNSTGSAKGVALQDVLNGSVIDLGNVGASVVDDWETPTAGEGDAIGFQARDIVGSRVSIAHAGAMTFDGDATGVDLRDIGDEAALTIGHIDAAAMNTGDAVGLSAQNVDAATVGLGEIESTSVGGDAYGVRIKDQVGNDASLVITGDITAVTQKADGTGTAYGIFAKSFGSNGLIVDHTVSAVADVDAGNEAFAVYAADGNNKVTIEKNAVLDAHNTETVLEGWAIRFGANTQADSKNHFVFDTKGQWNNGGLVFNTVGVSDFTFEEGTVATITGTQNMTTGKDGVRIVASTTVVKSGASVILDGTQTHAVFNMASSADDAGTFHVEEGGSIDAFSKAGADSAAIKGNLVLDGTMTLRFEGNDNVGLYVGDNGGEKGGVITVGDTAKIDVVLDGSFEGVLEVAETAWEDSEGNRDQIALDYISDKISTNTFYDLKAISVDGYLGYRGRDYVLMPEMYVLASQFHNARSIYDATADRFVRARTRHAGIGACDQACSTYDCDRPMKKNSFGRNAWVNWVGRGNDQLRSRVTGGNMDFSSSGVQVGLDVYKSNRFLIGMMYGYEDGKLNAKDGYGSHMKGEDNYFGFYGQAIFQNSFDLSGTIGYGSQDFDLVRSNRYGTHKASFDADSFEATLELGYMFKPRKNLTFRPVLALDIYNSDVDGATETGDWDRSRYNGYSLTQTFLRFGADARLTRKWFSVDTGVYYSYQMNSDAKTVSAGVTSVNQLITRPMEYKLGDSVLTVNVGGNVFLNKARTLSLFGGYYVDFYTDRINDQALHNGRVGVSYRF